MLYYTVHIWYKTVHLAVVVQEANRSVIKH